MTTVAHQVQETVVIDESADVVHIPVAAELIQVQAEIETADARRGNVIRAAIMVSTSETA